MSEERSDWVVGRPQPALRPFVERYCGYRMTGFPAGLHRGVPSRHLTFIVSIGNDIDVVRQTNPADAPGRYRCAVGGLQASSALIAHDGNQEGVVVELTPLGSRALFGLPAAELWDRSLELADVIGADGGELWERLQSSGRWEERFAACDDVLARRLRPDRTPSELRFCWTTLVASGGQIGIQDLARETGWSRQHLRHRFRQEFGLAPKLAARVVRFERARRMLVSVPPFVSIAQVAAVCGYYDHAHLDRDFLELAGCTPSELLTEDLPSFQDDGGSDPSSSAA